MQEPVQDPAQDPAHQPVRERPWWILMIAVLAAETLALAYAVWQNLMQVVVMFGIVPGSILSLQVGLTVILVGGLVWVVLTLKGAFQRRSWVRASNLTIQVLFLAAATGIMQGILGKPSTGVMLLGLAILGLLSSLVISMRKPQDRDPGGGLDDSLAG